MHSVIFDCPSFSMNLQGRTLRLANDLKLESGNVCLIFAPSDHLVQGFLYLLAGLHRIRRLTFPSVKGYGRTSSDAAIPNITLSGLPIYTLGTRERAGQLSMIYQNPEVAIIGRTVIDEFLYSFAALQMNLFFGAAKALEPYGLQYKLERKTDTLSGGERHRLNCACALEVRPKVVIADFTSSNLDSDFFDEYLTYLGKFAKNGGIVIVAGVRIEQVKLLSYRPKYFTFERETGFSIADQLPSWALSTDDEAKQIRTAIDSRPVKDTVIFEGRNIFVPGRTHAPFSVEVRPGEILLCSAPNGFGKTTVANVIARRLRNSDASIESQLKRITLAIQHPERSFLVPTIKETLMGDLSLARICGFCGDELECHPRELSPSRQKLLGVAAALQRSDGLAVLDEPTCGMDTQAKMIFCQLLSNFLELGIIIFTHDRAIDGIGRRIEWS